MALPFPTFLQTKSKVACALLVAGEKLEKYVNVKDILTDMGTYFQVQDDYLDCFSDPDVLGKIGTDIEDFKCSWLVVKALERANGDQKKLLHENYGKSDQACITKVKELYIQLGLEVYPIFAVVGTAVGICGMQLIRNITTNPEVRVTKENRMAGILDNHAEGEKYAVHGVRKYIQGRAPEIMPSLNKFFSYPN